MASNTIKNTGNVADNQPPASDIMKDMRDAEEALDNDVPQSPVDSELANTYGDLIPEDSGSVEKEIGLERKYGDSSVQAGIYGAARGLTAGLSDLALTKAGLTSPETLKELKERNPIASNVGEFGTLAAGLLTGTAVPGLIAKAGASAEKVAELGLKQILKQTGRSNMAKKIIKSAASGAVEGALYGAGQTISESSLGDTKLNAEMLLAGMGSGAALGGALNAGLSGAAAALPTIKRTIKPVSDKLLSKVEGALDASDAAKKYLGYTPSEVVKIQKRNPKFFENMPKYLKEEVGLSYSDSAESLLAKNLKVKEMADQQIDESVSALNKFSLDNSDKLPPRKDIFSRLESNLSSTEKDLLIAPETNRAELRIINRFRKELQQYANKEGAISFKELNELRKAYGKQSKFSPLGTPAQNFKASIADDLRHALRGELDILGDIAEKNAVSESQKEAGRILKKANKNYNLSTTIEDKLARKVEKGSPGISAFDLAKGAVLGDAVGNAGAGATIQGTIKGIGADLPRKFAILADIKKSKDLFNNRIVQGVGSFLGKASKPAKTLSTKALINSGFSKDEKNQAPKSRLQAYNNVSNNISKLSTDLNGSMDRLAKSTAVLSSAAPETASHIQQTLVKSVMFLQDKLPKSGYESSPVVGQKQYEPSDSELSKFERYMQIIDAPATAIDELERGTLTREHVEVLQAVYPSIYEALKNEVIRQSQETDSKKQLPYGRRIQLGTLFDMPTDESLLPANIMRLQSNFSTQPGAPQPGNIVRPNIQNATISDRRQSGTEQIINKD